MDSQQLHSLLEEVRQGKCSVEKAVQQLKNLSYESVNQARLDHHRHLRRGLPEAIFGETKTKEQLLEIIQLLIQQKKPVLITRVKKKKAKWLCQKIQKLQYYSQAQVLCCRSLKKKKKLKSVAVVAAGLSDLNIAEEASVCLDFFGLSVVRLYDVGVAGIHRFMDSFELVQDCQVIIVVAGMEGALPSFVAGLVDKPVIAVPTSVGYGSHLKGIAPLLAMLNSCAGGIGVVNIDNGFGAALLATMIVQS